MTPLEHYYQDLSRVDFIPDPAQEAVVGHLERLYQQLLPVQGMARSGRGLLGLGARPTVKGLYIWGRVGRGKTHLMDGFCRCLPEGMALRLHFHRFMHRVHQELRELSGCKNPLETVAENFRREARVLCFDEFSVADIGDAMILANLLEALFERGMTLVATSNTEPDQLYANGLQRRRFLPAISLIKQYNQVLSLDGERDYRRRALVPVGHYFSPLSSASEADLEACFTKLSRSSSANASPVPATDKPPVNFAPLLINGRRIAVRKKCARLVWFEFDALCDGPRSQLDYIEISQQFDAVIVSNIPVLGGGVGHRKIAIGTEDSRDNSIAFVDRSTYPGRADDPARRFVALVDEFYDRRVQLIISAAAPIAELYAGGQVSFEFRRTVSRLIEMQSEAYVRQQPLSKSESVI